MTAKEAEDFRSSLCDLTVNSKPLISMLTMLAEESSEHAEQIVQVIENHILKAKPTEKLPSLYLIDSILKNLRNTDYSRFFQRNIVNVFCDVFDKVEESTRQAMFKVRQTWSKGEMLPARKLYALDVRVNQIDPAWPVVPLPDLPSNSIHVNPKFLPRNDQTKRTVTASNTSARRTDMAKMMETQRKELEKIQQMQVELELAKAKAQLEAQKQELAQLQARLQTNSAADVEGASNGRDVPTDPRLRTSALPTHLPQDPRQSQQPPKSHPATDSRKSTAILPTPVHRTSDVITTASGPNILLPGSKGADSNARGDKPLATSVGALLSQAAAEQSSSRVKLLGRKGSKLPKLRELDKEDVNERGFSSRRGNDRSFNSRGQWSRGRSHGYRAPERQLPYERPGVNDNSKGNDSVDSSSRRRRRGRSRSRSRSSSRSRSRSLSPRRADKKSSKLKDSRKASKVKAEGKRSLVTAPETGQSESTSTSNKETKPPAASSSTTSELGSSAMDISTESDNKESLSANKSAADVKPVVESSGGKEGKGDRQKEDTDLRKRKRSPESKKRVDSKSPDVAADRKKSRRASPAMRSRSPGQGKSSPMKKCDDTQDLDMRKGVATVMDKDEDLRSNRDKLMKKQWESSKAKRMPRIPKRNRPQYRERDDTSPVDDSLGDGPPLGVDEVVVAAASKTDLDLRSLPVVRAPSRSDTDSSDSDAEVLADINKRREERSKIIEGGKSSKEKDGARHKSRNDKDGGRQKKRQKGKNREETFDEDEDFRIRPPVPKSDSSSEHKDDTDLRKPLKVNITKRGADEDLDLRVPASPASHGGWNKFKKDNPNDFYTPDKAPARRQRAVVPLHMNDKGLDVLDQKDLILKQAEIQFSKREITREQFDEVKHRFQELELIKRAHKVKASSMLAGDRHHRPANPYDQRGGGPMVIQRQRQMLPQANLRPLFDPRMVALLRAIQKNSDDPRVRMVLNKLQGGSSPLGRRDSGEGILSSGQNSPIGRVGGLLPTPEVIGSQQPNFLTRTDSFGSRSQDGCYEFIIDGQAFELPLNMQARKIPIGGKTCRVLADPENREIIIDGSCYYKIGEPVRSCYIGGCKHKISYHGPYVNFWLDQMQKEARVDAPSIEISFDGNIHSVQIEGHTNTLRIDGQAVGPFGSPAREISVEGRRYFISFEPPAREILIDGHSYRLKSDGPVPLVVMHNKLCGIRFEGAPQEICIDDMTFTVPLEETIRVKVGMRSHRIGFGGPGQEVVIDGKPHEVMFDGPSKLIKIGGTMRNVRLPGPPPSVKILDEVMPDDSMSVDNSLWPNRPVPPLAPPPRPPAKGLLPTPSLPSASDTPDAPAPYYDADSDMRHRPHSSDFPQFSRSYNPRDPRTQARNGRDLRHTSSHRTRDRADVDSKSAPLPSTTSHLLNTTGTSSTSGPAASLPKTLDISSLVSGLIKHGFISQNKDGEKEKIEPAKIAPALPKMDDIPDLTSLTDRVLRRLYSGVVQRLYTGNQCATCGLRFQRSAEKEYSDHLDWHFRQNTRDKNKSNQSVSRLWYIQSEDWVSYDEFSDIQESNVFVDSQPEPSTSSATAAMPPEAVICPKARGTEESDSCCVCREPFERFWNDEEEEWHLKDAVRVEDKTYHPVCYEDAVENSAMETGDETASKAGSVPPSPRSSVAQSPAHLVSPRTFSSTSADVKEGEGEPKEQQSMVSAEPATAFDLLSGLISKTEAKPGGASPQQVTKDDPLQMLAGLMKAVKPPPAVDLSAVNLSAVNSSAVNLPVVDSSAVNLSAVNPPVVDSSAVNPSADSSSAVNPSVVSSSAVNSPACAVSVKEEVVDKQEQTMNRQASVESGQLLVKEEIQEVKVEPVGTSVNSIGTLGGLSVPTVVRSNVTLIRPSQDQPATADAPRQSLSSGGGHSKFRPTVPSPTQSGPLRLDAPRADQMAVHSSQQVVSASQLGHPRMPQGPQMSMGGGPPRTNPHQQHIHPPMFRGAPPMPQQTAAFIVRPPNSMPSMLMNRPQSMMVPAGAPPHMMMSTMPRVVQPSQEQEDEGTPVRDELTDDVARCPTPVMDEPGEDGGSTPVRDEWD